MNIGEILTHTLYILVLMNPVSKISVLSTIGEEEKQELKPTVFKSTLVAFLLLLVTMIFGNFLLQKVFHLQIYSLQISGGIVLATVGFRALRNGVFFERDLHSRFSDMAIVPLACPMIAGPAVITAALTLGAKNTTAGMVAITIALSVNLLIMLLSQLISAGLKKMNVLGALIRITGLVVMTMGIQMISDGVSVWNKLQ